MVELTHNGSRYMVDGGEWFRRLEVNDYRVKCTDPRPPFVVGQRVKVARKDETCGYWFEDMDDLVGQSGEVFRYTTESNEQEVPSVKFDEGEYWNFPPWCLDAVTEVGVT